ncbi:DMT family transporter [Alicyclobacillus dauci]|uniref:EamA family transporter n=1 Tax=Alicyclobacillus dauci TaxID=1475485 RepID=A0ABY6YZP1_9BACL|nr:EamA family transporter [Alicyclobacillus dauci]WAH35180.1 EamA family transporter [Alicyclobacillus dauci]
MVGLAYIVMCLIYGTTFLGIRVGDNAGMPPFLFAAIRFCAAGLVTLFIVAVRDRKSFPQSFRSYLRLASVGFFTTTGVFAIVYDAERYVPSGYAALMSATMPFIVMILGRLVYRQTIIRMQYVGLAVGFVGVFAVAWPGLHSGVPHWLLNTFVLLVAQIMASVGALQSRSALADGMSPFVVNGFQCLFGGIGLLLLSVFTGELPVRTVHQAGAGIGALVYLTIFGSIIASTLFYWLIERIGALLASTWTYISPIIAVIVGRFTLREPIYSWTIIGAIAIIGGVILLNLHLFRGLLKGRAHMTPETPVTQK